MKNRLEFDPHSFSVRKATRDVWHILRSAIVSLLVTLSCFVILYLVISLVFSTDTERRMIRERRTFRQVYPELLRQKEQLSDAVAALQYKDNEIYEKVFHSNAPEVDPMNGLDRFYESDTIPDYKLNGYTGEKADRLLSQVTRVDAAFERIAVALASPKTVMPPMRLPVSGISYPQVGASKGTKMSPFLKAYVPHSGIDLLVSRGTDVLATEDGVVANVSSTKTMGKAVLLSHRGGYETFYAHLESVSVRKGALVKAGNKVGSVGMTGNAYAPHLHYEVRKDGEVLDPVNTFFASVTPDEYANMLYMSINTMQSMD